MFFVSFRAPTGHARHGVSGTGSDTYRQQVTISAMPMISRSPPPAAAITTVMSWYARDKKDIFSLRDSNAVISIHVNISTVLTQGD